MKRQFLNLYLDRISGFPKWVKKIILNRLSDELGESENLSYLFVSYKPVLTYKGKYELDSKTLGLDNNIYNFLKACGQNLSISEIVLNTYMTLEEVARNFLLCIDGNFIEAPKVCTISNVAKFLSGKYRTGEYYLSENKLSEAQLDFVVKDYQAQECGKKFGQMLVESGLVSQNDLDNLLSIKSEADKRFILDYTEVPNIKNGYKTESFDYLRQIEDLKNENNILKTKLEQLLVMTRDND